MTQIAPITFATRFRGFLPVVVDVETGGFHATTDALLEIAAVLIDRGGRVASELAIGAPAVMALATATTEQGA